MKPPVFSKLLFAWYHKNARKLPWRETNDPYKIWVSEIMLQQTQVKTVIPYYQNWLKRFPTLQALGEAPQADVLKHWAGLGYYRRARMLHEGARYVIRECGGRVPEDPAELQKIPGIGRYTAGAIASIAFQKKTPVVDGNVIRILTRITALGEDIGLAKTQAKIWQLAASLMPQTAPGDFNQAMMELGATVCFPGKPQCGVCPVSQICEAHKKGKEMDFPVRQRREKIRKISNFALILKQGNRVLIQKQSEKARWGGLWVFPFWTSKKAMLCESGFEAKDLRALTKIAHAFTRYRIELNVFEARKGLKNKKMFKQCKWISSRELSSHAFPSPHQKIIRECF